MPGEADLWQPSCSVHGLFLTKMDLVYMAFQTMASLGGARGCDTPYRIGTVFAFSEC